MKSEGGQPVAGAPGAGPLGGKMREEIMKRFDKDGDGQLNAEERAAMEQARERNDEEARRTRPCPAAKLREEANEALRQRRRRRAQRRGTQPKPEKPWPKP